jgi:hypothetical protein
MKATDFDMSKDIKFDFERGITSFRDTRLVIFDADAFGLLRHSLVRELGWERTRALILRFGYQNGYSDFMQMKINYEFDSPVDLLASGPVLHTWEGIVKATPKEIRIDPKTREFYFTGVWRNSYEAEQHLCFGEPSAHPVCWSLTGYASGWCTGFWGEPLLAIEPVCAGKGDDHCERLIKPIREWGPEAALYIDTLKDLFPQSA